MRDSDLRSQFSKRWFAAGIILVVVVHLLSATVGVRAQEPEPLTLEALLNGVYQGVLDEPVQLTGGEFVGPPVAEGDASRPTVVLTDYAFGDLDGDGVDDAAVILAANMGGSGNFRYLAAVINQDGEPVNVATVFLGDRVAIEALGIDEGQITIAAMTHGPEDPLCCPSVATTLAYTLDDGALVAQTDLGETTWVLLGYGDPDAPQVVLPNTEVTAKFDIANGRVSGNGGCNQYFADVEVRGTTLTVSPVGATMMACDEVVMAQEQAFLSLLEAAEAYALAGGYLRVLAGEQVLVFMPQPEAGTYGDILVIITAPPSGAELIHGQPVHVAGIGRGLFEGTVVVQVLDSEGHVLVEQATIAVGEDVGVGGIGSWALDLAPDVEPDATVQILAFSPSARDGSMEASDSVTVTFRAE